MNTRLPTLLLLLVCATAQLAAQPDRGDIRNSRESLGDYFSYGDQYFFEVSTMPGHTPGRGRAVVLFRLSYDLLTFRRLPPTGGRGVDGFEATPTVYVEAIAIDGVIADRRQWRDTIVVDEFSRTNSKTEFVPGSLELSLRPGLYTLRTSISDGGPGAEVNPPSSQLFMDNFEGRGPAIGVPLFLRSVHGDTLLPSVIGGGALFGDHLRLFVPIVGADSGATIRYDLAGSNKGGHGTAQVRQSGLAVVRPGLPGKVDVRGSTVELRLDDASDHAGGAIIDARIDDLEQGTYTLVLSYQGSQGAAVIDSLLFPLRWVEQPVSLYRLGYAIRALYPVANEATIDSMLGLDDAKQEEALRLFWDERDPTPGTRFNEAMAEYYRRVDYAYFNFKSVGQSDGVFTDRGKIYILFGAPTDVNRQMQPDSHPREVWTYQNRVARTFVFIDESKTGEYRLVEYHDL